MPKINQRLNGQNPLAYIGVDAGQPTDFITDNRNPSTSDYRNVFLGTWWLNTSTNALWYLVSLRSTSAIWLQINSNAGSLTLTGNTGGAVSADALKQINLISGVSGLSVDGNPGTNTLTLNGNGTLGLQYNTDSGNAVPSAGILNVVGGLNINTVGSGNTIIIKTPTLAEGVVYANSSNVFTSLSKGNNGEILIGQTGSTPAWNMITSSGGTVTITPGANSINLEVPTSGGGGGGVTSGFSSYLTIAKTNVTGDGTQYFYVCDKEEFDIAGDYNTTTGIFTAPSTGYYFLGAYCYITNTTTITGAIVIGLVSSTGATYQLQRDYGAVAHAPFIASMGLGNVILVPMTMHDTIKPFITISGGAKTVTAAATPYLTTTFFGYRLPT